MVVRTICSEPNPKTSFFIDMRPESGICLASNTVLVHSCSMPSRPQAPFVCKIQPRLVSLNKMYYVRVREHKDSTKIAMVSTSDDPNSAQGPSRTGKTQSQAQPAPLRGLVQYEFAWLVLQVENYKAVRHPRTHHTHRHTNCWKITDSAQARRPEHTPRKKKP